MKLYLIAGERSGDLHGSNLIYALRKQLPEAQFRGFGGDYMQAAGMELVVHYKELAFMGFVEVIMNLTTISRKLSQCKQDILAYKPDVLILIDYAGFNMRIASFARKNGIPVYWYISPKVWAWNQSRAVKLKGNVDRMFVILPFEKQFFKKFNWDVDFVGNPVLDAVKNHVPDQAFLEKHSVGNKEKLVALLPGSRKQELERIIPLMTEVAKSLPQLQFGLATVSNLDKSLYGELSKLSNVFTVEGATYDLLSYARAAVVTSGTATLETAMFKVPQVVVYKTSAISYSIAKRLIKVNFISLVNLIADKQVVRELIQYDATVNTVKEELLKIATGGSYRDDVLRGYDQIINQLNTGSASENTARLMIEYLKK